VIGVSLGMLLGAAITQMYTQFFYIPFLRIVFYPGYLFSAILLSAVFSVMAGLMGARTVLGIHPAESMRPEPPKKGHRTVLEKTRLWRYLSFTEKIVVRNLLRSKKRFVFITLGIALTYAITMVPMFQANAFDNIFIRHYSDFLRMDYNINFSEPVKDSALGDLKHLIEYRDMEPKLEYPFEVEHDWKKKVVTVVGIESDSKMYAFKTLEGKKIALPSEGLLITEGLAKFLRVQAGDNLKINTFIPGRDDQQVRIISIIDQSLGMNIYMDLTYMQNMFLERGIINGAMVTTNNEIKDELADVPKISSVQSNGDLIAIFKEFLKLTLASVSILIVFSGVLGFAIVYNSSVMSLLERKLEFSSLRVMGFRKNEIFFILLRENVVMTVIGIIIGIPLGRAMLTAMSSSFSTELYTMKVDVPFNAYVLTAVLTFVFVVLAQVATYSRIHRLDFIEALKNRMT
jgi:putative ABC transport system permease protein